VRSAAARIDRRTPAALPTPESLELPESLGYRIKKRLLGPPLVSEQLRTERLGKPTALAVLSSDVLSSSAYATEQILRVLVVAVGVAAFSLTVPVTLAILVVLLFVTLSYREVIWAYPKAGGAYVVSRENFGPNIAQIAGVSLLIDYTLTVAVSMAAGVSALTSAVPSLTPYTVEMSVAFVLLMAYGNLRGIREAGRTFAVPTYLFIANMAVLIGVGLVKEVLGDLHAHSIHTSGAISSGSQGSGLLLGASLFIILRAFSDGGSALTGTEAISNAVSIFRPPERKNARSTLVLMSIVLGSMVLGVSLLSSWVHAVPYVSQSPTVLSQVAKFVYGSGGLGTFLYYFLQIATLFILVLAANTSFTGFPFLASFVGEDSFLPRQLTRRGHRLVFSNGIIVLTVVSIALLIATGAQVASLISLYAIGVFTGFTMAGAGMVKHHLTHRESGWRHRLLINGSAAVLSFIVDIVIVVTKFTSGAWLVVVLLPVLVFLFIRLNRQYRNEEAELEEGAPQLAEVPIPRRHAAFVLIDRLDLAAVKAIQYARTLGPDQLRLVHFVLDERAARLLEDEWTRLGMAGMSLELVDVPDRRLRRAVLEMVAEALSVEGTEATVLLPRRIYPQQWTRLLHDRTADSIAETVDRLPNARATIVPFQVGKGVSEGQRVPRRSPALRPDSRRRVRQVTAGDKTGSAGVIVGTTPIGQVQWRQRARVAGRVKSVSVQPSSVSPNLLCKLVDPTGGLTLVFPGRRKVAGIEPGARLVAEGTVGEQGGRLAIFSPDYELLAPGASEGSDPEH
jgi:amino acid transporter